MSTNVSTAALNAIWNTFFASSGSSSSSSSNTIDSSIFTNLYNNCTDLQNTTSGVTSTSGVNATTNGNATSVASASGFSSEYDAKIVKYANKYNLDPNLVKAVIKTESGFNPKATSSCNCQGLMQVNPQYNSGNLYDVDTNLEAGCRILREGLDEFNGDTTKALMAYNLGIYGAKKKIAAGKNSTSYSDKVLGYYNQLNSAKSTVGSSLSISA